MPSVVEALLGSEPLGGPQYKSSGPQWLRMLGDAAQRVSQKINPSQFVSASDAASMLPGGGLVSAVEPYQQGLQKTAAATQAFREGRYKDAAMNYGSGMLDTANAGLQALPEGGALMKLAGLAGMGIKAFHGSPHDFDKFDMSKIGTGEGAQAYGHGLYFAENEDVARGYRNRLAPTKFHTLNDAENDSLGMIWPALRDVAKNQGADAAAARLDKYIANTEKLAAQMPGGPDDVTLQALRKLKENGEFAPTTTGSMYEVNIKADPEHFLDWDKPLSEQHSTVQDAVNRVGRSPEAYGLDKVADDMRGIEMKRMLQSPDAARALAEQGVPGIKYLDAGSRTAGDGSRNYVVFDDKLVEIVKKYGWVPGMAIPAAMALEMQQAQQPAAPQM